MKFVLKLILVTSVSLLLSGLAAAQSQNVKLSLDSIVVVDPAFPVVQSVTPTTPVGYGSIDIASGTGVLNLQFFSLNIDLPTLASGANIATDSWQQTIAFTPGLSGAGAVTSTASGTTSCSGYGSFGGLICAEVPLGILPWPPTGGFATIDTLLQTIVTETAFDETTGTIFSYYSYDIVPEPSTALLLGGSLAGLAMSRQRRRSASL